MLIIDDQKQSRVVDEFSYDGGSLVIKTRAASAPSPTPMPTQPPRSGGGSECRDSGQIICTYDFQYNEHGILRNVSPGRHAPIEYGDRMKVTIPPNKTVVSKLEIPNPARKSHKIHFETPSGEHTNQVDYWISEIPGGPHLDKCGPHTGSFIISFTFVTFDYRDFCQLDPGKRYFLNVKSTTGVQVKLQRSGSSNSSY